MSSVSSGEFVTGCLWPGVTGAAVQDVEGRVKHDCAAHGSSVDYVGSVLMPEDEVVLYFFVGCREDMRRAP